MPAPWSKAPDPLAWQLRNMTPWLPTTAEQDASWLETYGDQAETQRQNLRNAAALSAMFAS